VAVVVKDLVWPQIGYRPHLGQQAIHRSRKRFRVASGGRRLGKSTTGGHELVPEAALTFSLVPTLEQLGKQRRFWIAGPDYSDTEKEFRVIYNDLKRLQFPFDRPGTYNNADQGDMKISLFNGAFQIDTKSAKDPESMDGEGLFGVVLSEAAKLKPIIWGKFLRPALADEMGWALMLSTPEGRNWFYREWQRGQDPEETEWESWRQPSWTNNYLFPGGIDDPEIQSMRRDMSEERFNQEIGADFSDFVGRVFKDFDEELHVRDLDYHGDRPLVMATDYGWTNPFVALAIQWDVWDNIYVLGEYRETNRDINDIGRDLGADELFRQATEIYPDPAEPGDTAVLEKALHVRAMTDTGGELKHRIELIRKALRYDPLTEGHPDSKREPKLFIDRKCVGLIREMQDYRYPNTKEESVRANPEKPMDKDDHGPEALGRFMRGHFGGPAEEERGGHARVRRATVRSA
jgi:hypothetical protein